MVAMAITGLLCGPLSARNILAWMAPAS